MKRRSTGRSPLFVLRRCQRNIKAPLLIPGKCATDEVREAMKVILSDSVRYRSYKEIMSRPVTQEVCQSGQGYFWLHYDITGSNAVPLIDDNHNDIPDFVERGAIIADSCWRYEVLEPWSLAPAIRRNLGGWRRQIRHIFS